jgi:transcriptional regulator with XRE-family HTH domain
MDAAELGRTLRARRKSSGRTIASVAMEAGLSVPYVANLENGRGNPTLSALRRLAAALGTRMEVNLMENQGDGQGAAIGNGACVPESVRVLLDATRTRTTVAELARASEIEMITVREGIAQALLALRTATGHEPSEHDLNRLLDLLLLSQNRP